jgi:hypothetical protein
VPPGHCISRCSLACVAVLLFAARGGDASGVAALDHYYASDGVNVILVQRDPHTARVTEWAAFYYRKGTAAGEMSARWGIETKSSPEEVMRSVEANQKFERSYEKWCGCSWGDSTFFNVMAPVAMVKPEAAGLNARQKQLLERGHEAWHDLVEFRDKFNELSEQLDDARYNKHTQLPVGSGPIAEFLSTLHDSIDNTLETMEKLGRYSDIALDGLERTFARFESADERLNRMLEPALRAMRGADGLGSPPAVSGSGAMTISGNLLSTRLYGRQIPFTFANDGTRLRIEIRDSQQGFTNVSVAVSDLDWESMQMFPELKDYVDLQCRDDKPCISGEVNGRRVSVPTLGPLRCQQLEQCRDFIAKVAPRRR